MQTKRVLKTKDLPNQTMDDVFEEFYRLKDIIQESMKSHEKNHVIIRLVTIIEQFFRCVVEIRLEDMPEHIPSKMEIDPRIIDSISDKLFQNTSTEIKNHMISLTYSFQNTHSIHDVMNSLGLPTWHDDPKSAKEREKFEELFQSRHGLIHTVDRQSLSYDAIMNYHVMTEQLMHVVLDGLNSPEFSFYIVKGDAFYAMGYNATTTNCYYKALKKFKETVKQNPEDIATCVKMALTYLELGDLTNMERYADMVLKDESDDDDANYCKGIFLQKSGHLDAAANHYKKCVDANPYHLHAHYLLIYYFFSISKIDECMASLDCAIQHMPEDTGLYLMKGKMLHSWLHNPAWADACFKQADECALEFVGQYGEDADECKYLLDVLGMYGRVDAVMECRKILESKSNQR